ncbi:hypothetical protein, partial [Brachybacterium alimentarium]|uniref:hypothetical protein n=1 Tax=Brachybacterium alimentarium TaxID=47845 RepID=UPI003FD52315
LQTGHVPLARFVPAIVQELIIGINNAAIFVLNDGPGFGLVSLLYVEGLVFDLGGFLCSSALSGHRLVVGTTARKEEHRGGRYNEQSDGALHGGSPFEAQVRMIEDSHTCPTFVPGETDP